MEGNPRKRVKYDTKLTNRANNQSNNQSTLGKAFFQPATPTEQPNQSPPINHQPNKSSPINPQSIDSTFNQSNMSNQSNKKKLVIRPFKVQPAPPAEFETSTMTILHDAVEAVFQSNNQPAKSSSGTVNGSINQTINQSINQSMQRSLEELYHAVQSLCSHKKSSQLFNQLITQLDQHTKKVVEQLAQDIYSQSSKQSNNQSTFNTTGTQSVLQSDESILQSIVDVWHRHCAQLLTLRSIFLYLDRTYIIHQSNNQSNNQTDSQQSQSSTDQSNNHVGNSLWDIGLSIFRQYFLSTNQTNNQFNLELTVRNAILRLIDCDRSNQSINQSILRDTCRFYQSVKLFDRLIDQSFYQATKQYYTNESNQSINQFSLSDYVHHVDQLINQERSRVSNILFNQTINPSNNQAIHQTINIVQQCMVADHADRLIDQSFDELIKQSKLVELRLLYRFYQSINQSVKLKDAFARYVKATGHAIMNPSVNQTASQPSNQAASPTNAQAANRAINQLNNQIIPELLKFKRQLDVILDKSFTPTNSQTNNQSLNQSNNFEHAMKVSFESFLNESSPSGSQTNNQSARSAELLAAYIDRLLRSRSVNQSVNQSTTTTARPVGPAVSQPIAQSNDDVDQLIWLFRYIHAKDVFIAFYSINLSKRLINQSINQSASRSTNKESEELFLAKLKTECGSSFTKNCEQMFKDMELSRSINQSINQLIKQSNDLSINQSIDFQADVLTSGCWPTQTINQPATQATNEQATESQSTKSIKQSIIQSSDFLVPAEILEYQSAFQTHYLSSHSGRKLQWSNQLSNAVVRANLPRGRREFVCNAMQATVLYCFNTSDDQSINQSITPEPVNQTGTPSTPPKTLSFNDLQTLTRLAIPDLKRTLMSLACHSEIRVLLKDPRTRTVEATDRFRVDMNFHSTLFRVPLPILASKDTLATEQTQTEKKVWEDRAYAIDAALVRIMKARKTCSHNELISETISTLSSKFPVQIPEIKKRIGGLIEREYLERDPTNSTVYQYLA